MIYKGSHTDAVRLRCTFMIAGELKRADVVKAHTGRKKAPGFETHARVERKLARLEVEPVQSMIAIFTRIEDESGTVLDLKNEESTCNSLNKDLKILLRLLNNDINNRKNSVSNKFIKNDISTLVQAILLLKIGE